MQNQQKVKLLTKQELQIWLTSFCILTLSFCPIIFNFIWGNHDWMPLIKSTNLTSGFIEGRISQYLFTKLLLDGHILPILNTLLGFLIYTLSLTILSSRFFEFKSTSFKSIFIVSAIATLPYINEITYFQFIVFSQLCWPLIITLSLLFAKQASIKHPFLNTFLCFALLFLSIAGYPASSNLYVVATVLYIFKNYTTNNNLKLSLLKLLPFLISFILSFALLYVVYNYLKNNNLMIKLYNNETTTILDIFIKTPTIFIQSIQSLLQPQPFFSIYFKLLTFSFVVLFIYTTFYKYIKLTNTFFFLCFIFAIFISLKFSALLTNETKGEYFAEHDPISFMIRADFYAIPCFILFCLYYILQNSSQFLQNIAFIFLILIISTNINNNLNYSKVQNFGFTAETILLNKITNQITSSKNFNNNNYYTVVQAGELPLRQKYYQPYSNEKYGFYTLKTPYVRHWIPDEFHNFYEVSKYVKSGSAIYPNDISTEMADFLSKQITYWPSPNSIFVNDKYAIIALTKEGQEAIQSQFSSLSRGL